MTTLVDFDMTTVPTQLRGLSSLITVDRRLSTPLYRQIYDGFRARVIRGELRAGQIVPSTRELARELRISRLPVLDAYAQLLAEGYFESRVGAGTFIATSRPRAADSSAAIGKSAALPSEHNANLPLQMYQLVCAVMT